MGNGSPQARQLQPVSVVLILEQNVHTGILQEAFQASQNLNNMVPRKSRYLT